MQAERNYIPITEAESSVVKFNLQLPEFVDQRRIGAHVRQIEKLCDLGGIESLTIISNSGEISSSEVAILGFDSLGNAFAGRQGTKSSVDLQQTANKGSDLWLPHAARWMDSTITINVEEIASRINNGKKWENGLRDPKAWSYYLNKSIKESLIRSGTSNLLNMNRVDVSQVILIAAFSFFVSSAAEDLSLDLDFHMPTVRELLLPYLLLNGLMNYYDRHNILNPSYQEKLDPEDFRGTFFYGFEPDRALVLNIVSQFRKLVKTIQV